MMSLVKTVNQSIYISFSQRAIVPGSIHTIDTFGTYSTGFLIKTEYTSSVRHSSLPAFLEVARTLSDRDAVKFLSWFADEKTIELIQRLDEIKKNLRELLAIIWWIAENYREYGAPSMSVVIDEETNEFQFVAIIFPKGDWNSWRKIASNIKDEMKRNGLEKLASRVAIICLEALQEH